MLTEKLDIPDREFPKTKWSARKVFISFKGALKGINSVGAFVFLVSSVLLLVNELLGHPLSLYWFIFIIFCGILSLPSSSKEKEKPGKAHDLSPKE